MGLTISPSDDSIGNKNHYLKFLANFNFSLADETRPVPWTGLALHEIKASCEHQKICQGSVTNKNEGVELIVSNTKSLERN